MYIYNQFGIELHKNINQDIHLHPDVEIIYVLEGKVEVCLRDKKYQMRKGDVIVVNSSTQHSLKGSEDSIVCCIEYDYKILVYVVKKPNSIFLCNSCADDSKSYKDIRKLCNELVCQEIVESHKTESYKYSLMYQILDILIENYLVDDSNPIVSENYDADEKLQQIIHYVHENYQDGISLSELAQKIYTSTSTLSRLFKKQTGTYFAEYVNEVRIHYAVIELLYTEKNITKIAMDCGFSNASALNKVFREIYGMAPTEYRLNMKARLSMEQEKENEVKKEIRRSLQFKADSAVQDKIANSQNTVEVNVTEEDDIKRIWNKVINVGPMQNLSMANVQFQLQYLVKDLGFTHARVWSVFSKSLMICDGTSIGMYNYDVIDDVFDFLVQNHIYLWLDFTIRPNTSVRAVDDVMWYEDDTIIFSSRRAWENLFEDFLKHIVKRYGLDVIKNWYFEIGKNPFHENSYYYIDPEYSFANVYQFAYQKIREIVPGALIGISAGPSNMGAGWSRKTFKKYVGDRYMPDFVAFILFPYIPHFGKERTLNKAFLQSTDREFVAHQIEIMHDIMQQAGIKECKLFVSEWNITVSTRNFLNDSCFRGAYICEQIAKIVNSVDVVAVWLASDWICSYYDSYAVVNGASGLLTKAGIRKPAYFALHFLNRLGNKIIARGDNYILTKKSADSYVILSFNVNWYSPSYFMRAENLQEPETLQDSFEHHQSMVLDMMLSGVCENCTYIIKRRSINAEHGSILDEWKRLGFDKRLERADVKYLQEICIPHLTMERVVAKKDKLRFSIPMESQEFVVCHIFPAD